jgi:hypothetical protein
LRVEKPTLRNDEFAPLGTDRYESTLKGRLKDHLLMGLGEVNVATHLWRNCFLAF